MENQPRHNPEQRQYLVSPSQIYQQHLVPALLQPWLPELIGRANLQRGQRVIDIACGTGVVALQAADHVGSEGLVVGLDNDPGMLEVARNLCDVRDKAGVIWQEGNATFLPFAAATFDVVFCQQGLQYLQERQAALREMRRVLAPGGRLVLSVWCSIQYAPGHLALAAAVKRYLGAEIARIVQAPFSMGDMDSLGLLISSSGFQAANIQMVAKLIYFASVADFVLGVLNGSPAANIIANTNVEMRTAIVHRVSCDLASYVEHVGLTLPMATLLAFAQV